MGVKGQFRICCIEDHISRECFKPILQGVLGDDVGVDTFENPEKALSFLSVNRVDVLITDLTFKDGRGVDGVIKAVFQAKR